MVTILALIAVTLASIGYLSLTLARCCAAADFGATHLRCQLRGLAASVEHFASIHRFMTNFWYSTLVQKLNKP